MSFFRVAALLVVFGIVLCAVGESATAQNSATKEAAQPNEIPKSIAESVGGTLEFAEGNFLGLAEATAAFTGLRRGELSAMRWENWQPGAYAVNGSVWNARVDTTKTEGSAALIPVVPYLEQLWREHHQRVGKPRAGWMFATARNTPEWPENVVSRAIKPVLDRCVVCGKGKVECDDEKAGKIESRVEHDYHRDAKLPEWRGWHASQGELQCRNISW